MNEWNDKWGKERKKNRKWKKGRKIKKITKNNDKKWKDAIKLRNEKQTRERKILKKWKENRDKEKGRNGRTQNDATLYK